MVVYDIRVCLLEITMAIHSSKVALAKCGNCYPSRTSMLTILILLTWMGKLIVMAFFNS